MNEGVIFLSQEDITTMPVDAIVNAANSSLLGGGGIDEVIHRAAGTKLLEECRSLNGCQTGSAKITSAYNLPSRFVIHAVGPVWRGGNDEERKLLKSCYETSLELASANKCDSIAFSNISTGIYGFPKKEAAEIAIQVIKDFLAGNMQPKTVYFVCFDPENYRIYEEMLG